MSGKHETWVPQPAPSSVSSSPTCRDLFGSSIILTRLPLLAIFGKPSGLCGRIRNGPPRTASMDSKVGCKMRSAPPCHVLTTTQPFCTLVRAEHYLWTVFKGCFLSLDSLWTCLELRRACSRMTRILRHSQLRLTTTTNAARHAATRGSDIACFFLRRHRFLTLPPVRLYFFFPTLPVRHSCGELVSRVFG
jgi:hypothetical protein